MRESRVGVWAVGIIVAIAFGPAIIVGSVAVFVWSHILKPIWRYLRDRMGARAPRFLRAVEAFTGLIVTFIGLIAGIVTLVVILFMVLDGIGQVAMMVALPVLLLVQFFGYIGAALFVITALLLAGWLVLRRWRPAPSRAPVPARAALGKPEEVSPFLKGLRAGESVLCIHGRVYDLCEDCRGFWTPSGDRL